MDRHEVKARISAQNDEWDHNLEIMKAKAKASAGDAKVRYEKDVAKLQDEFNDYKIRAAKTWDVADDKWDAALKDLELWWDKWELRAKEKLNELTKQR